jgi:hypothetical protein
VVGEDEHLFSTENQSLLDGWDAFFLLDFLLDLCDLQVFCQLSMPKSQLADNEERGCRVEGQGGKKGIYLIIGLNIKFDFLPRESSDPIPHISLVLYPLDLSS